MYERKREIEDEVILDMKPSKVDRYMLELVHELRDEVIEAIKADDKNLKDYIFTVYNDRDYIRCLTVIKVEAKHKKELVV